ncbi:phosphatase PAP2 family protein [Pseudomonas panipatensis]|uniref:undecaprenyl-diphosphate phosphatase n=1 Tax=Pseudomonas panipatensis TaxID=428992 RepID=A0A1G8F920_9PSED|nr:phosphatase PAP2 family protein [Pseudomonas panipatensis]SDH78644.1 undecaprenyl-diphosphatase [Pseudomonas panipatensis]SMP54956.1 undecaprenyl-diphosphatase [Pseudomonas panipatensis]
MTLSSSPSLLETLNREAFLSINAGPATPGWLLEIARLVASVPLILLPAVLLAMWCWGNPKGRGMLLRAVSVTALALLLSLFIGLIWPHPRPFAIGLGHAWLQHAANASFPSDHLTIFAGIAISLLFDGAVLAGALFAVIGLIMGYARVYLGIHYPLDMLGALAVAALSNSLIWLVWQTRGQALTSLAENLYRRTLAPAIARGWIRP